jgi:hypothetical protein
VLNNAARIGYNNKQPMIATDIYWNEDQFLTEEVNLTTMPFPWIILWMPFDAKVFNLSVK